MSALKHGPTFVNPQDQSDMLRDKSPDRCPDNGDRDSLVSVPRKPTPTLGADAIAIPEPDSH